MQTTMPFPQNSNSMRPESSQKKQQSISSFFTPKASSTPKSSSTQTRTNSRSNAAPSKPSLPDNGTPRIDDEDGSSEESGARQLKRQFDANNASESGTPLTKRQRQSSINGPDQTLEVDQNAASIPTGRSHLGNASAAMLNGAVKSSHSERLSKYKSSNSHARDENDILDEDDEDEESKQLKQSLHRRFVKKLGKPDSIADIKRRNRFIDDNAEVEEGAEIDEEEDDDPAAKSGKGRKGPAAKKGSKKLTPMEQQIIDLKRNYMDTLLVVEVGYKFKFFGEDARIAAKELGIVCIPGKFRFDERESDHTFDEDRISANIKCRPVRGASRSLCLREFSSSSPSCSCKTTGQRRTQNRCC
jgi:DNA mismatch repair protein MSH3